MRVYIYFIFSIIKKKTNLYNLKHIMRRLLILVLVFSLLSPTITSYAQSIMPSLGSIRNNTDIIKLNSTIEGNATTDLVSESEFYPRAANEEPDNNPEFYPRAAIEENIINNRESKKEDNKEDNIDEENNKDSPVNEKDSEKDNESSEKNKSDTEIIKDNFKNNNEEILNSNSLLDNYKTYLNKDLFEEVLNKSPDGFVDITLGLVQKKPTPVLMPFGTSFFSAPGETAIPANLGTNSISINLTNPEGALHTEDPRNPYILWTFIKYVGSLSTDRVLGESNDTFATFAGSGLGKPEIQSLEWSDTYPSDAGENIVLDKAENTVSQDGVNLAYSVRNNMSLAEMKVGYYTYTIKTPITDYKDNYILDANSRLSNYFAQGQEVNSNGNIIISDGSPIVSNGSIRGTFSRSKNNFRFEEDRLRPVDFLSNDMIYHTGNYSQNGGGSKLSWFANAFNTHRERDPVRYTINTTLDSTQDGELYKNYIFSIGNNGFELKNSSTGSGNSSSENLNPGDVLLVRRDSSVKGDDTNRKMWHTFGGPSNRESYTPGGPNNQGGSPFESIDDFKKGLTAINPEYEYTRFAYIEPFYGRNKINKEWKDVKEDEKSDIDFKISSVDKPNETEMVKLQKGNATVWDPMEERDRWIYDESTTPIYNPWRRISWNVEENSPTDPPISNGNTSLMLKVIYTLGNTNEKRYQNVPMHLYVDPDAGTPTLAVAYSKDASFSDKYNAIYKKVFPNGNSGMQIKQMWVDNNGVKGEVRSSIPIKAGVYPMIMRVGPTNDSSRDEEKRVFIIVTENDTPIAWTVPTRYRPDMTLEERWKIIKEAIDFPNLDVNIAEVVMTPSYIPVSESWSNKTMIYNFTNTKIRETENFDEPEGNDCLKYGVIKVGHPVFDPNSDDPFYPYKKEQPTDERGNIVPDADPIYKVEPGIDVNSYEYYRYPEDFKNDPNNISSRNRNDKGTFYQGGWLWGQFRIPAGAKAGDTFDLILPRELKANMQDVGTDDYVGPISASIGGTVKTIGYISHELIVYRTRDDNGEVKTEEVRDKFTFHLNSSSTWFKPYIGSFSLGSAFNDTDALVNDPLSNDPVGSGVKTINYALKALNAQGPRTLRDDYKHYDITAGFVPGAGAFDAGNPYNESTVYHANNLMFETHYSGNGFKECPEAAAWNPTSDVTFNYRDSYVNKQNSLLNKFVLLDEGDAITWRVVYNGGLIQSAVPKAGSYNNFYDVLVNGTQLYHGNNQTPEELERNGDIKVYVTPYGNITGVPENNNEYMFLHNTVFPKDPMSTDWFKQNNYTTANVWINNSISRNYFTDGSGLKLNRNPQIDGKDIVPTSVVGVHIGGSPPNTVGNNIPGDGKWGYSVVMDITVKKDPKTSYTDANNNNNNKYVNTMYSDQSKSLLNQGLGEPFRMAIYAGSSGGGSADATGLGAFSFSKELVPFNRDGTYAAAQKLDPSNSTVEFTLVNKDNLSQKYTATTNDTGRVFFDGIPNGTYDLIETIPNQGYAMIGKVEVKLANGTVIFNGNIYDANGNKLSPNSTYDVNSPPVIKNFEKPKLKIVKRDSKTGELLDDFKITIQNSLGGKKNEFGPGSPEVVPFADGMKAGMYLLAEVQYPEGYGPESYKDPETGDILEKNYVIKVGEDGKIYMRYDGLSADIVNSGPYNRGGIKFEPLTRDSEGNYNFRLNNVKQEIPPKLKYPTAEFSIIKRNAKNMAETIEGAEFTVYTDKNAMSIARRKGADNTASGAELKGSTGRDGILRFDNIIAYHMVDGKPIPGADYYMKETKVPDGYNAGSEGIIYHIHIDENGRVFIYEGAEGNDPENKKYETGVYSHMVVTNTKTSATLRILKKDKRADGIDMQAPGNNVLAGASFQVFNDEKCTIPLTRKIPNTNNYENYIVKTDNNGIATIDNLIPENKTKYFYLKEIVAPNGYSVYPKTLRIAVTPDVEASLEWQAPNGVVDGTTVFHWISANTERKNGNTYYIVTNSTTPRKNISIMKRDWGQVMDFWRTTVVNNIWADPYWSPVFPEMFGSDRFVYGSGNGNTVGSEPFRPLSAPFTLYRKNPNGGYDNIATKITRGFGHGNYPLIGNDKLGEITFDNLPDGNYKIVEGANAPGVPQGYEWQENPLGNPAFDNSRYQMVMYFRLENGNLILSKAENEEAVRNNNLTNSTKEKLIPFLVGNEYTDGKHPVYMYNTMSESEFGSNNYHIVVGNTRVFKLNMTKKDRYSEQKIVKPFELKIYKYTGYTQSEFENIPHSNRVSYETDPKTKMVYAVVGLPGTITNGTMQNQSIDAMGYLPGLYYIEETRAPEGYIKPEGKIPFFILEDGRLAEIKADGTIIDPKVTKDDDQVKVVGHLPNGQKNLYANPFNFERAYYSDQISQYVINFDFYNIRKPKFMIHKTGKDNVNLKGAKFTLYYDEACQNPYVLKNDSGSSDASLNPKTTDEEGNLTFENLEIGKTTVDGDNVSKVYYLKENQAPPHYELSNKVYKIEIDNKGNIKFFTKENGAWNEIEPSNEDGAILTVAQANGEDIQKLNIGNVRKSINLILRKRDQGQVDEFYMTTPDKSDLYASSFDKNRNYYGKNKFKLLKAAFELYKKNGNSYVPYNNNNFANSKQETRGFGHGNESGSVSDSDNSGAVTFNNLSDGEYMIQEFNVPPGYEWDQYPDASNNYSNDWYALVRYFTIENGTVKFKNTVERPAGFTGYDSNGNQRQYGGEKLIPFVPTEDYKVRDNEDSDDINLIAMNIPLYNLNFKKVDPSGNPITINAGNPAKIRIFAANPDGSINTSRYVSDELTVNPSASNSHLSSQGYAPGLYYLKETQVPTGYMLPEGKTEAYMPFYIQNDGRLAEIRENGDVIATRPDGKIYTTTRQRQEGDPEGARGIEVPKVLAKIPESTLNSLVIGYLSTKEVNFANNRYTMNMDIKNIPDGSIRIKKLSFNNYRETDNPDNPREYLPLAGTKFNVYSDDNGSKGDLLTTVTTDEMGMATIKGLKYYPNKIYTGDKTTVYYIQEAAAPTGYQVDKTVYRVGVSAYGKTNVNGISMPDFLDVDPFVIVDWPSTDNNIVEKVKLKITSDGNINTLELLNKMKFNLVVRTRDLDQMMTARLDKQGDPNNGKQYYNPTDASSALKMSDQVGRLDNGNFDNHFNILDASYKLQKKVGANFVDLQAVGGVTISPDNMTTSADGDKGKLTFEGIEPGEYKLVQTRAPEGYFNWKYEYDKPNQAANFFHFKINDNGIVSVMPADGENTPESEKLEKRADLIALNPDVSLAEPTRKPNEIDLVALNLKKLDLVIRTRDLNQAKKAGIYDVSNASSTLTKASQIVQVDGNLPSPNNNESYKKLLATYSLQKLEANGSTTAISSEVSINPANNTSSDGNNMTLKYSGLAPGDYVLSQTTPPSSYMTFRGNRPNTESKVYKFRISSSGVITPLPDNATLGDKADIISLSADRESANPNEMDIVVLNDQGFYLKLKKIDANGNEIRFDNPGNLNSEGDFNTYKAAQFTIFGTAPGYNWDAMFPVNGEGIASNLAKMRYDNAKNGNAVRLLPNKLYFLKEAKAPDGYHMLGGAIKESNGNPAGWNTANLKQTGLLVPFAIRSDGSLVIPAKISGNVPDNNVSLVLDSDGEPQMMSTEEMKNYRNGAETYDLTGLYSNIASLENRVDSMPGVAVSVKNDRVYNITIDKLDEKGNEITNTDTSKQAQFEIVQGTSSIAIFNVNGPTVAKNGQNPIMLKENTIYTLKETRAPDGYDMYDLLYKGVAFAIDSNGDIILPAKLDSSNRIVRDDSMDNSISEFVDKLTITKAQDDKYGLGMIRINVKNEKKLPPPTGINIRSFGNIILTLSLMIIAAFVLLIIKRRYYKA